MRKRTKWGKFWYVICATFLINVPVRPKKWWYSEWKVKAFVTIFVHISVIFQETYKILSYERCDTFSWVKLHGLEYFCLVSYIKSTIIGQNALNNFFTEKFWLCNRNSNIRLRQTHFIGPQPSFPESRQNSASNHIGCALFYPRLGLLLFLSLFWEMTTTL